MKGRISDALALALNSPEGQAKVIKQMIPRATNPRPPWKLMPPDLTDAMLPDAWRLANSRTKGIDHECLRRIYRAMFAAAPELLIQSPHEIAEKMEAMADDMLLNNWQRRSRELRELARGLRQGK